MHVVLCNCAPDEAAPLARALVKEGLAACVNVLPEVSSYYIWDEELEEDHEHTLLIKVAHDRVTRLVKRIRELHSYQTPEILVLPVDIDLSDQDYLAWVRAAKPLEG